jgi:hypothetical protein
MAIFWGKNTFFLYQFNKKIPILYNLWLQKRYDNKLPPLLFAAVIGSRIWDPRYEVRDQGSGIRNKGSGMGKNQDPGSGVNIPDPQHC